MPELRRLLQVAAARRQPALEARLRSELASRVARAGVLRECSAWTRAEPRSQWKPPPTAPRDGRPVARAMAAISIAAATAFAIGLWSGRGPDPSDAPPALREQTAMDPPAAVVTSRAPARAASAPAPQRPEARPRPAQAEPQRRAARTAPCRLTRSAADRVVCRSPGLAAQDRRMLAAYDRALSAGADQLTLDRGQALWRARRDATTSPARLRALYAERIRDLERTARRAKGGRG